MFKFVCYDAVCCDAVCYEAVCYDAVCYDAVCVCACVRASTVQTFPTSNNIFPLSTNSSHFSLHFTFRFTLGAIFLRPRHFVQRCDRCHLRYAHKVARPSSAKVVIDLLFIVIWFFCEGPAGSQRLSSPHGDKPYWQTARKKCNEDLEFSYKLQPTRCNVSWIYLLLQTLYVFQAVPPPIVRSTKLYIQLDVLSTNAAASCYRGGDGT